MSSLKRYLGLDNETVDAIVNQESSLLDKKYMMKQYIMYMLDRTSQMFEYTGLPETIPACDLERMLQTHGYVIIAKPDKRQGKLYGTDFDYEAEINDNPFAFYAGLGGVRDPYYNPTISVIANPSPQIGTNHGGFNKEFTFNKDAILVKNDTHCVGMLPLHRRYAELLVEAEISLRNTMILTRQNKMIIADNDRAMESGKVYLEQLVAGKFGIIEDAAFISNTRTDISSGSQNNVVQVIEALQYIKASWFNEIGLNSSFNMKREYISAEEVAANDDMLLPLIDDMLKCRQECFDRVNKMFGLNVQTKKNSAWEEKEKEKAAMLQNEAQGETMGEGSESSGEQS